MMKKLNERERYFVKQKLLGVVLAILGIITIILGEGIGLLLVIGGGYIIFTKEMVLTNDYFFEQEEIENEEIEP